MMNGLYGDQIKPLVRKDFHMADFRLTTEIVTDLADTLQRENGIYSVEISGVRFEVDYPQMDDFTDVEFELAKMFKVARVAATVIRDGGQTQRVSIKCGEPDTRSCQRSSSKSVLYALHMQARALAYQDVMTYLHPTSRARNKKAPKGRKIAPRFMAINPIRMGRKMRSAFGQSQREVEYIYDRYNQTKTRI